MNRALARRVAELEHRHRGPAPLMVRAVSVPAGLFDSESWPAFSELLSEPITLEQAERTHDDRGRLIMPEALPEPAYLAMIAEMDRAQRLPGTHYPRGAT